MGPKWVLLIGAKVGHIHNPYGPKWVLLIGAKVGHIQNPYGAQMGSINWGQGGPHTEP